MGGILHLYTTKVPVTQRRAKVFFNYVPIYSVRSKLFLLIRRHQFLPPLHQSTYAALNSQKKDAANHWCQ